MQGTGAIIQKRSGICFIGLDRIGAVFTEGKDFFDLVKVICHGKPPLKNRTTGTEMDLQQAEA